VDGRITYFVRPLGGGEVEIVQVPTGGLDPRPLVKGFAPAPHRDGKRLAYVTGEDPRRPAVVHLREMDTQRTSSFTLEERDDRDRSAFVADLAWNPDASRLGYVIAYEESGDARMLDPAKPGTSLWDGEDLPPTATGASQNEIVVRDGAGLAVLEACCGPDFRTSWQVVAYPASGAPERVADLGTALRSIDFDPSGRHLLFVRANVLYRWTSGEPVKVAEDVIAAVW
jgi:hypothetical protein